MTQYLPRIRYFLELISVPVFAWLVIHLAGHGMMLLKDPAHSHAEHAESSYEMHKEGETYVDDVSHAEEHAEEDHVEEDHTEEESHLEEASHEEGNHQEAGHAEHNHGSLLSLDYLLSSEVLGGVLALIFFTWLWHRKPLKRFVPCSHDHCHHKTVWPHVLATVAFVFHWFPESRLRYDLLEEFNAQRAEDLITALGFLTHFLVDAIVLVLLASFWPKLWQQLSVGLALILLWSLSVWVGEKGGLQLTGLSEPVILILSAFLLAMFVHKPHKPEPVCKTCDH